MGLAPKAPEAARIQRVGRGTLDQPVELRDSIPGRRLEATDPRTGSPTNVHGSRFLATGSVDEAWFPDSGSVARFAGSAQLRSAEDGFGGRFVVWADERTGEANLRLLRVPGDSLSAESWPVDGVTVCDARGSRYQADVASDGAGGAFLVWTDFRAGDGDIYAQHVHAAGQLDEGWPTEAMAVCTAPGLQTNPRIVRCIGGGTLIAWEDRRSGVFDVFVLRLGEGPAPAPDWPAGGVSLTGGVGGALSPALFPSPLGPVLAVWQRQAGSELIDLVAAFIGDLVPSEIHRPLTTNLAAGAAAIGGVSATTNAAGRTTLAWSERREHGASLRAQRVSGSGAVELDWPEGGVVVRDAATSGSEPSLLAVSDTSLAIAWQGYSTESESDVFVQMLGNDGTPLLGWPQGGMAACVARGDQYAPSLASDGGSALLVRWIDARPISDPGSFTSSSAARIAAQVVSAVATPGRARIVWQLTQSSSGTISAARRIAEDSWVDLAAPVFDDSGRVVLDDRTVPDGVHAEYRLILKLPRTELHLESVSLDIPAAPLVLSLHRVRSLGRQRALLLSFALPRGDSPRLDLIDVQGRRMLEQRIDGLDPGEQQYRWMLPSRVASGVYFLRLMQGREVRSAKVIYIQ